MQINMPEKVRYIIDKLMKNGYEAYAVGGCVRDTILSREPGDWDITTSAKPEQVKSLFERTIDTGIQHGTVTVMLEKDGFEVTTYRIDGEYEDGRHPNQVEFTENLVEDLKRRDFTINAMAYNDIIGIVDEFGGMDDLRNGVIRCVGNARERFSEDALRILRAIRFSAQLGFKIDEETQLAIEEIAPNLVNVSKERIQAELTKTLMSREPWKIKTIYETGIAKYVLPILDDMFNTEQNNIHHMYNVGDHTMSVLENIEPDRYLRIAALLHDCAKPKDKTTDENGVDHFIYHDIDGEIIARDILKDLKYDNATIGYVTRLVRWHDYQIEPKKKSVRKAINKMGEDIFKMYLSLRKADVLGQSEYMREEKLLKIRRVSELYEEIVSADECVSLKDLAVNGRDLIASGIKPGKEIGEMLKYLLDDVLENPEHNNREYLIAAALKK